MPMGPLSSTSTDVSKHAREATYAFVATFVLVWVAGTAIEPLVGFVYPVALFPLTGFLRWRLYWTIRTGPVVVGANGVTVARRGYAVTWDQLQSVEVRPPMFLRLGSHDTCLEVLVGYDCRRVGELIAKAKRDAIAAELPVSATYR